jgi:methylase of polypeptide subunit release factors
LNPLTANEVKEYAEQSTLFSQVEVIKDLSGKERIFRAVKRE